MANHRGDGVVVVLRQITLVDRPLRNLFAKGGGGRSRLTLREVRITMRHFVEHIGDLI